MNPETPNQPSAPTYEQAAQKKRNVLMPVLISTIVSILGIILLITLIKVTGFGKVDTTKLAAETKTKLHVPTKVDDYTTLTDITSSENAVIYHYVLSGIDETKITNKDLKSSLASSLCKETDTRVLLDKNISMQYNYTVENSPATFQIIITKADCK